MINEAAVFIRDEVRNYLRQVDAVGMAEEVLLGNVALQEPGNPLSNKVVMTLVNLEEESALKNSKGWSRDPLTGGIRVASPPVHLNLYFLFTATLSEPGSEPSDQAYQNALSRIAAIVEFFQSKKVFTLQNSPAFDPNGRNLNERMLNEIRLVPELYTLTFEQINHLWGSLGGKQSPFVMYKIRLVKIQGMITTQAPLIESIDATGESTLS